MNISKLSFIVTDDCNFDCSYCFQEKTKITITETIIREAVDFFFPHTKKEEILHIDFYGGEPLLAPEKVRFAVELIHSHSWRDNRAINFTLSTNGSLLSDAMLEFFNLYRFHLILSFDGLAQEICRAEESLNPTLKVLGKILKYPGIQLEINSVFTPRTISLITDSVRFLVDHGAIDVTLNICSTETWEQTQLEALSQEMDKLCDYLTTHTKGTGTIPVSNFRPPVTSSGIFKCSAGQTQMAISPEGRVWGCSLLHDYYKNRKHDPQYQDYSFGNLSDFIARHTERYPLIAANYAELKQNLFRMEERHCFLCPDLEGCCICPVNAAYSSGLVGLITKEKCKINSIQSNAKDKFNRQLQESGGRHEV